MNPQQNVYRKNFSLIIAFLVLISVTLVIALIVAYNLTAKYVENEFSSKKIDVLEQTIKPYNDFFPGKISEITSYQGFLDSASAAKYAETVFDEYPFVKRIVFYDIAIGPGHGGKENSLDIKMRSVFHYTYQNRNLHGTKQADAENRLDFDLMADKLRNFVAVADTSKIPQQNEIFRTFYDIKPDKISYLNIPRREEVKIYRELEKIGSPASVYKQNMMTFYLEPFMLNVRNPHKELYQEISIQPVVYDPLDNDDTKLRTEVALPGAFSDYKLYFRSERSYLNAEINRRFMPIGAIVLLIYFFIMAIGWLIYRNLSINLKLFKLQYDFINNFTHEFKTPVSVIKIAGSNLRGDSDLTERQRKHYGKILDEEADKLNELMNKLLSFTQIENRSIKLKREAVVIEEFVKKYIDTFSIKYPDFKLGYKLDHNVSKFYTDPVFLGSIFQNLIENAYKYAHPQHKELMIGVTTERDEVIFTFADKGIGIPKKELGNIFKKFYRIENQYNQNGSVGLGLAFCKELINFMNGSITVKSKINEGSEFTVTLPYEN
jgi:two-component system phosphate regulon sensor histidine kinase PhoR